MISISDGVCVTYQLEKFINDDGYVRFCNHNTIISSFMTYCGSCSKLVTANRSRTPEFTPVVSGVRIARSLVFLSDGVRVAYKLEMFMIANGDI
jgi:hypothetical protein